MGFLGSLASPHVLRDHTWALGTCGEANDVVLSATNRRCIERLVNLQALTAGWCRAVTDAQKRLKGGELVLDKPVLVLSTEADTILSADDIEEYSCMLARQVVGL